MSKKIQYIIPDTLAEFNVNPKGGRVTIPMPDWLKKAFNTISHWSEYLSGIRWAQLDIRDDDIPIGKLNIGEFHFPMVLPAQNFTTTSTTEVNIGPYFQWVPSRFPTGTWYLEAAVATSGGTATLTLKGSSVVTTITTTSATMESKRSDALTMPTSAQNLYLTFKSSSTSYTAALGGARLILVP